MSIIDEDALYELVKRAVAEVLAEHPQHPCSGDAHTTPARLLSVDAAATVLGLSTTAVWELIAQERIGSVKVGRRRLIPVPAIDDYVAALIDARRGDRSGDSRDPGPVR